ncbi:CHAD domain-containing protein [Roseospira marina]|uniref:CHAD domain-containing protein n=1 Tax=Roseospira marina TaxID=140057 RepID=UPI001478FE9F|nr:CHAD domain-containing protein [Roseospira marina]MBB4312673.1 CHAD domain-containing protein [Roseospira marina]MBB5086554.1 CHAD domain-containing protein [Roseospira marina]
MGDFACQRLRRHWRPVAKGIRRFDRLSEAERHRLRIDIKTLRYAVELFEPL